MNLSTGIGELFDPIDIWFASLRTPLFDWLEVVLFSPTRNNLTHLEEVDMVDPLVVWLLRVLFGIAFGLVGTAILATPFVIGKFALRFAFESHYQRIRQRENLAYEERARARAVRSKPMVARIAEKQQDAAPPEDDTEETPEDTLDEKIEAEVSNDVEASPINRELQAHLRKVLREDSHNSEALLIHLEEVLSPDSKYFEYLDEKTERDIEKLIATLKASQVDKGTTLLVSKST